tara:strand:- start:668 stop:880 length:213 start_codon:yes stop_codon:yes gene_type:complete
VVDGTFTQGNNGSGTNGGAAVESGDAQYVAGTNKGGNKNTVGGAGSISYSIDNASWVTIAYSGGVVSFTT